MKTLQILTVFGLVVALGGLATAVTVPAVPNGPVFISSNNGDNGTAYFYDGDLANAPTDPAAYTVWDGVGVPPAGAYKILPAGRINDDEDTWGVLSVTILRPGSIDENDIGPGIGSNYYTWGDNDTALVGIFWGANDTLVQLSPGVGGELIHLYTESEGLNFEIWAVDLASIDGDDYGPEFNAADRTAANRYADWVDGSGVKLLTGVSTFFRFNGGIYDNDGIPGFSAGDRFAGDSEVYIDIDETDATGLWNSTWGQYGFFTDPDGDTADARLKWTLRSTATRGWDTQSNDDGGVYVIPEPATMTALMLSVGGLVGYARRRRA